LKRVHLEARLVCIDAHVDAITPASSPSANLHGMPLTNLAGLVQCFDRRPFFNLKHLMCFGIRSYEPEELRLLKKDRIQWYNSKVCYPYHLPEMKREIDNYFFPDGEKLPYWI
jgi:arginase family enzyme